MPPDIDAIVAVVKRSWHYFEQFHAGVRQYFERHPRLVDCEPRILHSLRHRLKDGEHLRRKIVRKHSDSEPITPENVFGRLTDIAGIRVLHLYQRDFPVIHECIGEQLARRDWFLHEPPKAYTWDPESIDFFKRLDLEVLFKESYYTSIHYVVKPRQDSEVTCEIQVRTLFEEAWGEIDHEINYPEPTESLALREQIRVLARLVGAGTRLADAIHRVREA